LVLFGTWKYYDNKETTAQQRATIIKFNLRKTNTYKKIKMQQLTKAEEQLMEQLWKLESFMKDLLEAFQNKSQKRQRLPL
jgi:hypothetical protein